METLQGRPAPPSRTARECQSPPAHLRQPCFSRCSLLDWSVPARYAPKRSFEIPSRHHVDELSGAEVPELARCRGEKEPGHDSELLADLHRRRREVAPHGLAAVFL